jgi:hypothetical protein
MGKRAAGHGVVVDLPRRTALRRAPHSAAEELQIILDSVPAFSRSIVEAHDGRLWHAGGDGRGTTFAFDLPAEPAPPRRPRTQARRTR